MSIADSLRDLHRGCNSCQSCQCVRGNCNLRLEDPDKVVCIDVDRCTAFSSNPEKKPDYIILDARDLASPRWVVVEMKVQIRGHPDEIVKQLQEGARVIAEDRQFAVEVSRLVPLVLHEKGAHSQDVKSLQKARVNFKGKSWPILVLRCGLSIGEVG